MGKRRLIVGALVFLVQYICIAGSTAAELPPYPGLVEVDQSGDNSPVTYRLITGPIERSDGELAPESSEYVRGRKSTRTFEAPNERRVKVIAAHYQNLLAETGQILFQCRGRDCGSSTYWANQVFRRAILYGPEERQHYFLARVLGPQTEYLMVYVAERATGKIYVHTEAVVVQADEVLLDSKLIASALKLQGRFVFDMTPTNDVKRLIVEALQAEPEQRVALVVHDRLKLNESVDVARKRTEVRARQLKEELVAAGLPQDRLVAVGAGPISPISRDRLTRAELVVLEPSS